MEFHGKCPESSMENIDVKISMEFHGNCCPNVFHGNLWRDFSGIPWRLMS